VWWCSSSISSLSSQQAPSWSVAISTTFCQPALSGALIHAVVRPLLNGWCDNIYLWPIWDDSWLNTLQWRWDNNNSSQLHLICVAVSAVSNICVWRTELWHSITVFTEVTLTNDLTTQRCHRLHLSQHTHINHHKLHQHTSSHNVHNLHTMPHIFTQSS